MHNRNRNFSHRASLKMAFCGLIAALSVTLMLAGGIIPIATYCIPMASGILLLPVLLEFGKPAAWTTFLSVSMVALLLGIDKEAAFFYLFLGHYPLLKWELDRIKNKPMRVVMKLSIFSVLIIGMYLILGFIFGMTALLNEMKALGFVFEVVLLVLFNLCMLLYDRLMLPLVFLYVNRIRPRFKTILQ